MINPEHLTPLPYKERLSEEDVQMIEGLQENRAALQVINRLTFRFRRLKERDIYSETVDFDEEFPLLHESFGESLIRYFRLKGISVTRVPRTGEEDPLNTFGYTLLFDFSSL
ncbi:hypothetical protein [Exiguobacterium sp. R-17]|uniref:hypothetical protein n=1 Tax=Exiguobacterium sp. R-17 TaxID=3404054 RepID=UPI003CF453C6